jgi:hypothetical protein
VQNNFRLQNLIEHIDEKFSLPFMHQKYSLETNSWILSPVIRCSFYNLRIQFRCLFNHERAPSKQLVKLMQRSANKTSRLYLYERKYYTDESHKITNKIQVFISCKNGQQLTLQAIDIWLLSPFNAKLPIYTLT